MKKTLIKNKDANTTAMAIFSVIFLVVGIAVAGLLFTFTEVLGGQTYNLVEDDINEISSYTAANESFTADNTTWKSIGHADIRSVTIYNTTGYTDNTSNFDINTTTGYVLLISDNASLNGTTMRAVYQYDDGLIRTTIQNAILSNFEAQEQIGNYMPIIVLAVIITIIIGLIITGIASRFMGPAMGGGYYSGGYGGQVL